jgi:hypothetical protein
MGLPNEPKGWKELQEMAQREDDPQKLAGIIEQMNRLLDEDEKEAAKKFPDEGASKKTGSLNEVPQLSVQTWQFQV